MPSRARVGKRSIGAPRRKPYSSDLSECLQRRPRDRARLEREVAGWEAERNQVGVPFDWRFTADDDHLEKTCNRSL